MLLKTLIDFSEPFLAIHVAIALLGGALYLQEAIKDVMARGHIVSRRNQMLGVDNG